MILVNVQVRNPYSCSCSSAAKSDMDAMYQTRCEPWSEGEGISAFLEYDQKLLTPESLVLEGVGVQASPGYDLLAACGAQI